MLTTTAVCFFFLVLPNVRRHLVDAQSSPPKMADDLHGVIDCLYRGCFDRALKSTLSSALLCLEDTSVVNCFSKTTPTNMSTAVVRLQALEAFKEMLCTRIVQELDVFNDPEGFNVKVLPPKDGALDVSWINGGDAAAAASTRKMKFKMKDVLPVMLVPALVMSGIVPFIIPALKMAVMFVGMMNNMAFSSALFTLVRSYVFERHPSKDIVYVNYGYKHNDKKTNYNYMKVNDEHSNYPR